MSGIVTYADVAQWLPTDVREAIEASVPCRDRDAHRWLHQEPAVLHVMGRLEPVARIEYWICAGCGIFRRTAP